MSSNDERADGRESSTGGQDCRCVLCPSVDRSRDPLLFPTDGDVSVWRDAEFPVTEVGTGRGYPKLKRQRISNPLRDYLDDEARIGSAVNASGEAVVESQSAPLRLCKLCAVMFQLVLGSSRRKKEAAIEAVEGFRRRVAIQTARSAADIFCFICRAKQTAFERSGDPKVSTAVGRGSGDSSHSTPERVFLVAGLTWMRGDDALKPSFVCGYAKSVGVKESDVNGLLKNTPHKARLCNAHRQRVRHVIDVLSTAHACCVAPNCNVTGSLRPLRAPPGEQGRLDMQDACHLVFDGAVSLAHVQNQLMCRGHRYALEQSARTASDEAPMESPSMARAAAEALRITTGKVDLYADTDPEMCYMSDLAAFYKSACAAAGDLESAAMSHRSASMKLRAALIPRLALRGIYLDKSAKGKTYFFSPTALQRAQENVSRRGEGCSSGSGSSVTATELGRNLDNLSAFFRAGAGEFRSGEWSFREFVCAVPKSLWQFLMWGLSSDRRKKAWSRKAKEVGVDVGGLWPCGNSAAPAEGLFVGLTPSELVLIRRCATIIECMTLTKCHVTGPILTAVGSQVFLSGTRNLQNMLHALGVSCSSHLTGMMLKDLIDHRDTLDEGCMTLVPVGYFVFCILDNVDKQMPYSLPVASMDTAGCHVTFTSLHALLMDADSEQTLGIPLALRNPTQAYPTRESLVAAMVPDRSDPDLVAYQKMILGLSWVHKARLSSTTRGMQSSLRRVVFSALVAHPARKSTVMFARLDDFRATNKHDILRVVEEMTSSLCARGGDVAPLLGVSGDFPTFDILWRAWVELVRAGTPPRWFPVAGGAAFHDWKSGAFPTLKRLMEGCGIEEMLGGGRSGLSDFYVLNWPKIGNLRKNRRVLDQVIVAEVVCLVESLIQSDPEFEDALAALWDTDDKSLLESAQCQITASKSKLLVTNVVSKRVYKIGSLVRDRILALSKNHAAADVFLRVFLLDMMCGLHGSQTTLRVGQTSVYNSFWFSLSPYLMGTAQTNYQKCIAMQMLVWASLPEPIVRDLLHGKPGCLVVNRGIARSPLSHFPHDECLEVGVGILKRALGKGPGSLLDCVKWVGEISASLESFKANVGLSRASSGAKLYRDADGLITGYDREARGAANVAAFIAEMKKRDYFTFDHLTLDCLSNNMRSPPLKVEDAKVISALRSLREHGLRKLEILVSHFLCLYKRTDASTWPAEDLQIFNLRKQPQPGRWTRSGVVKSMQNCIDGDPEAPAGRTRVPGVKLYAAHSKRVLKRSKLLWTAARDAASTDEVRSAAVSALQSVEKVDAKPSTLALAYRDCDSRGISVESAMPVTKSEFFRNLEGFLRSTLQRQEPVFLREDGVYPEGYVEAHVDVENSFHKGFKCTASAQRCDHVIYARMATTLRPIVTGQRSRHLQHLHLHCDVVRWVPITKGDTNDRRAKKRAQVLNDAQGPDFTEVVDIAAIPRAEKEIYTTACLLQGGIAAVCELSKSFEASTGISRHLQVFLHGGSFVIEKKAIGAPLLLLRILRAPVDASGLVLVYTTSHETGVEKDSPSADGGLWEDDVIICNREDCLRITAKDGLQLFPDGNSRHGEGETRVVFAHNAISAPMLSTYLSLSTTNAAGGCLIVSTDSDTPAITLCNNDIFEGRRVVHVVNQQILRMDELFEALRDSRVKVSPIAISFAFAIGGCDFVPGTQGLPHFSYAKALLLSRDALAGQLLEEAVATGSPESSASITLTGFAYALHRLSQSQVSKFLSLPTISTADVTPWAEAVRRAVHECEKVSNAEHCMSEDEDIALQALRSSWVIQYWSGSSASMWGPEEAPTASEESGFLVDSTSLKCKPKFEPASAVVLRQAEHRLAFLSCGCKDCARSNCSCRKAGRLCLPAVCLKCEECCQNRGKTSAPLGREGVAADYARAASEQPDATRLHPMADPVCSTSHSVTRVHGLGLMLPGSDVDLNEERNADDDEELGYDEYLFEENPLSDDVDVVELDIFLSLGDSDSEGSKSEDDLLPIN